MLHCFVFANLIVKISFITNEIEYIYELSDFVLSVLCPFPELYWGLHV